ncbi:MAG: NAD-dependent epimerase/dehydratase family protein [Promethearchaeota archaeon]
MVSILITGGTGFIGISLVKRLHTLGHHLKLLIRESSDITPFEGLKNIEYFIGDVRDIESLYNAANGVELIYHLAGQVSVWAKDKKSYYAINVQGAENIAKVALKNDLLLFYISSFGALGPNPMECEEPTDESCVHVDFFINEYERTKFLGREKVRDYMGKGLKTVILYPGFVYGPNDFNIYGEMIFDIVADQFLGLPGKGDALFCMAYIDDVINGMINLIDREDLIGQEFVLGGENIKIREYLNLIAELAKVKKPRRIPMWAGVLYGRLCRFKADLSKKRVPYITPDMIIGMKYNWAYSSRNALEKLGYRITPIRDGLTQTVEWYKEFIKTNGKNKKKIGIRMIK